MTTRHAFKAEIQQLLNILVHSVYTEREIFLREAISNASDALNRLQFEQLTNAGILNPETELAVHISMDAEAKTITIRDTGIGMNSDELIENLGTIAHSGALNFMQAMQARGNAKPTEIIGQFGIGFYSVFMVADRVEVTSRSFRPEDSAARWISTGSDDYTVEPAEKAERGTEITLYLKGDAEEFLSGWKIESVIKKHSNYIPFPIYFQDKVVNAQTALWRRSPREVEAQEYEDFYKQLTFDMGKPLTHIHFSADAPVQFYSLLFVPASLNRGLLSPNENGGLRLYARKVLIQERSKDLLPEWMRFIEGIVDSEDIPLSISRETVQANRMMTRLKQAITSKALGGLEDLAKQDAAKYEQFWLTFGRLLKEGAVTDAANRDRVGALLRFRTNKRPESWISLADYIAAMPEDQTDIYYLFGEDMKALMASPHLELFNARQMEVLLLTEPIDGFMINALQTFQEKKLHNGADADLDLPAAEGEESAAPAMETAALENLVQQIGTVLGERVSGVRESRVLLESPARLVSADQGFGADMERVYRMLDQEFEVPKRILEINPRHALLQNLSNIQDADLAALVIEQLFENALLQEGIHPRPADMVGRIQKLLEVATRPSHQG
jgi:HSP90 family molecular chaperone